MDRPARNATVRRVLRACDNCRERKVKCNGNPDGCQQCAHFNLICVYKSRDERSRSRANVDRGSVLSRLKGTSNGTQNGRASHIQPRELRDASATRHKNHSVPPEILSSTQGPEASLPSISPLWSEFDSAFFRSLVEPYGEYIYCVSPVISPAEIAASIEKMNSDPIDFLLVHAYGAATVYLTQPGWVANPVEKARLTKLIDIAISTKSQIAASSLSVSNAYQNPFQGGSIFGAGVRPLLDERFIMSAIFLEMCLVAFRRHEDAYLMLRDAINLIQLLHIDSPRSIDHQLPHHRASIAKRERLYWEAFIHERFVAIVANTPIILEPLEDSIALDDESLPLQIREGFQGLIEMFCVIDREFVRHWRGVTQKGSGFVTKEWIEAKKKQLDSLDFMKNLSVIHHPADFASPNSTANTGTTPNQITTKNWTSLSTLQQADLVITRQWMLTLLWQLALSHCILPSSNPDHDPNDTDEAEKEAMSLSFPVRLSQQLRHLILQLGSTNHYVIERHGSGIIQKLFEITTTFADVIIHVPVLLSEERVHRVRDFEFLSDFLREFAGLDDIQGRILREKAELVRGVSR